MKRLVLLALAALPATAAANQCPIIDVDFQIANDPNNAELPQIVGWIEDAAGNFVDTIYITRATGTFGLGNRPGRFDFNDGFLWPYGRRVTTFPVWSHKHGLEWPEVVFQDGHDDNLSHAAGMSSQDFHFCRPTTGPEVDAVTCPTSFVGTDKGTFSPTATSSYPPREDLRPMGVDSPSVAMYAAMNPFDAVSQATPAANVLTSVEWAFPTTVPFGNYVVVFEVAKAFDMNGTYNETTFPSPGDIGFKDYGKPYRGQPSVIYRLPFTFSADPTSTTTDTYAGYGDPDGIDGNIRPPDGTMDSGAGVGAGRLALVSDGGTQFRLRVSSRLEEDDLAPNAVGSLAASNVKSGSLDLSFVAPGDDGSGGGKVSSYEVRFRVGDTITDANFADSTLLAVTLLPDTPGATQTFSLDKLLPETTYSIGIRAVDNCRNASAVATIDVTTLQQPVGEVDACFIATAAYGSVLANDVDRLRRFRDTVLSKTVLGELAIETYYTFGPPLAGAIGESDLLRATAREVLAPIVDQVKAYRF